MNSIKLQWYEIKARFSVIYIPNIKTFLEFQKIAFNCLSGKMGIMSDREVSSNGGFKYYQMEITKLPCSNKHTYV